MSSPGEDGEDGARQGRQRLREPLRDSKRRGASLCGTPKQILSKVKKSPRPLEPPRPASGARAFALRAAHAPHRSPRMRASALACAALLAHAALLRARVVVVAAAALALASPPAGYLVTLPPDAPDASFDADLARFPATRRFRTALRGAALTLRASQAEAFARRHPLALVERDGVVRAQGFRAAREAADAKVFSVAAQGGVRFSEEETLPLRENENVSSSRASPSERLSLRVSSSSPAAVPWSLDRVNQRRLPLDGRVDAGLGRIDAGLGRIDAGTTRDGSESSDAANARTLAYVLDSGVFASHADFGGRVVAAADLRAVSGAADAEERRAVRRAGGDCFGHGTAVASLAAGYASGLAPRADVVSARVLDCDGDGRVSDVVAGVDWALEHFRNAKASGNPAPPLAVMTLSLGVQPAGSGARSLEAAVRAATRAGVAAFVASGNAPGASHRADACAFSPGRDGRASGAAVVAASDRTDRAWADGRTGACVDAFAPGVDVRAASVAGEDAYEAWTGTSMAAPFAAGAALRRSRSRSERFAVAAEEEGTMITRGTTTGRGACTTTTNGDDRGGFPARAKRALVASATRGALWDATPPPPENDDGAERPSAPKPNPNANPKRKPETPPGRASGPSGWWRWWLGGLAGLAGVGAPARASSSESRGDASRFLVECLPGTPDALLFVET